MFSRAQRLQKSQDILAVLRKGDRSRSGPITVFALPSSENLPRFAFVVDTKVSKRAVVRNLAKRQMRAVTRSIAPAPRRYVIRGFVGIEKLTFQEIESLLKQCFARFQ